MIKIKKITKKYNDLLIFKNLNLEIEKNKTTVILGPSGSGKTTLLNIISGLDKNFDGKIENNYKNLSYVFQEDRLLNWKNVKENIEFVLDNKENYQDEIDHVLDILNIKDKKFSKIKELSGGQKQRVSIARAFVYPSEFTIMDEPFKSLDIYLKFKIIKRLIELIKEKSKTILFITHSIEEALLLGDIIYIFSDKPIKVLEKIEIKIHLKKRNLNDFNILEIEKKFLK